MKTKKSECLAAVNLDWPDSTDNIALNALTVNNDEDNHGKDNRGKDNHDEDNRGKKQQWWLWWQWRWRRVSIIYMACVLRYTRLTQLLLYVIAFCSGSMKNEKKNCSENVL